MATTLLSDLAPSVFSSSRLAQHHHDTPTCHGADLPSSCTTSTHRLQNRRCLRVPSLLASPACIPPLRPPFLYHDDETNRLSSQLPTSPNHVLPHADSLAWNHQIPTMGRSYIENTPWPGDLILSSACQARTPCLHTLGYTPTTAGLCVYGRKRKPDNAYQAKSTGVGLNTCCTESIGNARPERLLPRSIKHRQK